jgi:hypothetical protein
MVPSGPVVMQVLFGPAAAAITTLAWPVRMCRTDPFATI